MNFFDFLETLPKMRQKQIRQALYKELILDWEGMTTLPKALRDDLRIKMPLDIITAVKTQKCADNSTKWLLETRDGLFIETVLMQFDDGRNTVCVSSQIGCPVHCAFCATGQNGFTRNLLPEEIVFQTLLAAKFLKEKNQHLTNAVFMGMGEPLLNLENVCKAVDELNSAEGFNLGARKICISTTGPLAQLADLFRRDFRAVLAISLHSATQAEREKLIPTAKYNKLPELFQVLDDYVDKTNRKVSYQYIMLDGVNDSEQDALVLANLMKDRLAFVNLIRYNYVEGLPYKPSSKEQIEKFKSVLRSKKVPVTVRVSLGDEISAACGQLAGKNNID